MRGVELAFGAAKADQRSVILLGAAATHAEVDYGWIEAEAAPSTRARNGVLRVKRFWEKPSPQVAEELLDRGCIWNTFVMVGSAQAFLDMIRSGAREIYQAFEPMLSERSPEMDPETMNAVYEGLAPADFSRLVLTTAPQKLGVLSLGDVGWSDLGSPQRVTMLLAHSGVNTAALSAAC